MAGMLKHQELLHHGCHVLFGPRGKPEPWDTSGNMKSHLPPLEPGRLRSAVLQETPLEVELSGLKNAGIFLLRKS